jgi:uncharacterized protein YutE (UPF0331/DUF86 family)
MDEDRVLSKIDELNRYLGELEKIKPKELDEYRHSIENKRACERLLQISIGSVIDICSLVFSGLKLGMPADEESVFEGLEEQKVFSGSVVRILSGMKGMRNILVHKYGTVDDEIVFESLTDRLGDFEKFIEEALKFLRKG